MRLVATSRPTARRRRRRPRRARRPRRTRRPRPRRPQARRSNSRFIVSKLSPGTARCPGIFLFGAGHLAEQLVDDARGGTPDAVLLPMVLVHGVADPEERAGATVDVAVRS